MNSLINCIKKIRILYLLYYYIGSFIINLLKLIVKTEDDLILFVSYGGRYYNDSPQIIYEAMLLDKRFKDYKMIWAFRNPNNFNLPEKVKIKIDTFKYFVTALKARCWVTNVVIERALNFKGKNTFYFHTTHGVLPKFSGKDVKENSFDTKANYQYDISCAQCTYEADLQARMYQMNRDKILVCGYPRNDKLIHFNLKEAEEIKLSLHIPQFKKVIMYAPTYREDSSYTTNVMVNFNYWEKELGDEYVILYRAHPVTRNTTNINSKSNFVIDCSDYADIMDLYLITDILISDYSGVFFDFAILNRPMVCYGYDYKHYIQTRNLYVNLCEELPGGDISETELLYIIKHTPTESDTRKIKAFRQRYVSNYGNATTTCLNVIYSNLK